MFMTCPNYHQDLDVAPRPEGVHPPVFSALRQSRGVSSTSEEEEALTEKFLKINCKYITDGMVRQLQTALIKGTTCHPQHVAADGERKWFHLS